MHSHQHVKLAMKYIVQEVPTQAGQLGSPEKDRGWRKVSLQG